MSLYRDQANEIRLSRRILSVQVRVIVTNFVHRPRMVCPSLLETDFVGLDPGQFIAAFEGRATSLNLRATVVSHITNIDPAGPRVYDPVAAVTQQGSGFAINVGRPPDQILNLAGPGSEVGHATISEVMVNETVNPAWSRPAVPLKAS
jgi:hypothetical protein